MAKSSFSVTGGRGTRTSYRTWSKEAPGIIAKHIKRAYNTEYAPLVQKAYEAMTADWKASPQIFARTVVDNAGFSTFTWGIDTDESNANKRWGMVDTEGRPHFTNYLAPTGAKAGLKGKTSFTKDQLGQIQMVTERVPRSDLKPMPMRPYTPRVSGSGNFGGSGKYGTPSVFRWAADLGGVRPKFLTEANVVPAVQGKGSPLSFILPPLSASAGRRGLRRAISEITGLPQV
jgi:hypothetical protein